MTSHDPRIDAYIARQADFARPILEELRRRVHAARPARGASGGVDRGGEDAELEVRGLLRICRAA